ncbi:MAG: hypothetical protein Q8T08_03365 [Ignavibacteria bacterium]|nr:hypothetical protein [Ignavibacteria bacterium]
MTIRQKYVLCLTLLLLLNLLVMTKVHGQTHDYDKLVKEYLINNGEIKDGGKSSVYAFELLKSNKIKDNNCGIFRIGTFSDHGLVYLFLIDKDKNGYLFLDFKDLSKTIEDVLTFLDNSNCNFTDKKKLAYLRKVIEIYTINKYKIPW